MSFTFLNEMNKLCFKQTEKPDRIYNKQDLLVMSHDSSICMHTHFCCKCGNITNSFSQNEWPIVPENTKCKCKIYYPQTIPTYIECFIPNNNPSYFHKLKVIALDQMLEQMLKQRKLKTAKDMVAITSRVIYGVLNLDILWV